MIIEKPEIQTVLDYAKFMVDHFVKKKAYDCPAEHKEEMKQEAFVRILNSYEKLDVTRGWKSFVFNHCRGAVMDYQKFGKGFAEQRWSLQKNSKKRNNQFKINSRLDFDREDQNITLDSVMMNAGLFASIQEDSVNINWDLIESMAFQDETIHIFAKHIRGFEISELSEFFKLSRARICQIIEIFIERFDAPELVDDIWFKQTCYAFGLCKRLNLPNVDQSIHFLNKIGWTSTPIKIDSKTPIRLPPPEQIAFVGIE